MKLYKNKIITNVITIFNIYLSNNMARNLKFYFLISLSCFFFLVMSPYMHPVMVNNITSSSSQNYAVNKVFQTNSLCNTTNIKNTAQLNCNMAISNVKSKLSAALTNISLLKTKKCKLKPPNNEFSALTEWSHNFLKNINTCVWQNKNNMQHPSASCKSSLKQDEQKCYKTNSELATLEKEPVVIDLVTQCSDLPEIIDLESSSSISVSVDPPIIKAMSGKGDQNKPSHELLSNQNITTIAVKYHDIQKPIITLHTDPIKTVVSNVSNQTPLSVSAYTYSSLQSDDISSSRVVFDSESGAGLHNIHSVNSDKQYSVTSSTTKSELQLFDSLCNNSDMCISEIVANNFQTVSTSSSLKNSEETSFVHPNKNTEIISPYQSSQFSTNIMTSHGQNTPIYLPNNNFELQNCAFSQDVFKPIVIMPDNYFACNPKSTTSACNDYSENVTIASVLSNFSTTHNQQSVSSDNTCLQPIIYKPGEKFNEKFILRNSGKCTEIDAINSNFGKGGKSHAVGMNCGYSNTQSTSINNSTANMTSIHNNISLPLTVCCQKSRENEQVIANSDYSEAIIIEPYVNITAEGSHFINAAPKDTDLPPSSMHVKTYVDNFPNPGLGKSSMLNKVSNAHQINVNSFRNENFSMCTSVTATTYMLEKPLQNLPEMETHFEPIISSPSNTNVITKALIDTSSNLPVVHVTTCGKQQEHSNITLSVMNINTNNVHQETENNLITVTSAVVKSIQPRQGILLNVIVCFFFKLGS